MSGPKPSTVVGEPPDAPLAVSGATRPDVPGDAAVASTFDVPVLPSSQEDLDVPLAAPLGDLSQYPVDSTRGGEDVNPPVEKGKRASEKVVISTTSPRVTRFLPDFAETFSKLESSRVNVQGECFVFFFGYWYYRSSKSGESWYVFRNIRKVSRVSVGSSSKPAGSSGKRHRTVTLSTVAQSHTLRVESGDDEEAAADVGLYTSQVHQQRCLARQWRLSWRPVQWSLSLTVSLISLFSVIF